MKVGVVFPSRFEEPGEFLADVRAMETAGVDSIWLQDQNDGLDPLLMLAAIAAVTSQVRVGLIAQFPSPLAGEGRGGEFDQRQISTLQQLSRNRLVEASTESWQRVEVPADRDAWASTLERAQQEAAHGVLVPSDPRLLDILRHPDDPIDRSDLILAQG